MQRAKWLPVWGQTRVQGKVRVTYSIFMEINSPGHRIPVSSDQLICSRREILSETFAEIRERALLAQDEIVRVLVGIN